MAKSIKTKKEKEKVLEPIVDTPKLPETVVEETIVEPVVEEDAPEVPEVVPEPVVVTNSVVEMPKINREADASLSMEERIAAFVENRGGEVFVKLNDFLKSLYPLPRFNEPPVWLQQGSNKQIRVVTQFENKG